jgi:hypothetical protein
MESVWEWLKRHWLLLSVSLIIGSTILIFNTPQTDLEGRRLDQLVGAGKPVVVELYSNT